MNRYIVHLENSSGGTVDKVIVTTDKDRAWTLGRNFCIEYNREFGDGTYAFNVVREDQPNVNV